MDMLNPHCGVDRDPRGVVRLTICNAGSLNILGSTVINDVREGLEALAVDRQIQFAVVALNRFMGALIALVTDYDCWRNKPPGQADATVDPHLLLKEIIGNLQTASQNAIALMKRAVELMSQQREQLAKCPAQHALELGIWLDKSRIDRDEVQRLAALWMKYF